MDLGRTQNIETSMRHREAVEQKLSSSLRQAQLVDDALAELDHQLAEMDQAAEVSADRALRASARALLVVAATAGDYDVTLVPEGSSLGVRVRKTLFRLQADLVTAAPARPTEGPSPE
jgi:hypothetical protein